MRFRRLLFIGILLMNLWSCKDWLDLQPEASATETEVFSSGDGFRSVLNGVYQTMGRAELYGRELSWGFVDCLSQQYTFEGGESVCYDRIYPSSASYEYTDSRVVSVIENIWRLGFNVIANANNLIQNLELASADLFAGREMERKMILGEAYGCRALMQFDLLRLFAPAPVNDDGGGYVPYVESYPDISANGIDVTSYLDKVIADLEKARELVMEFDTSALGQSASASGGARFQNELEWDMAGYVDDSFEDFFKGRGFRLSYYSITALLARVCLYAEKYDEAFEYAKTALNFEVDGDYTTYRLYEDDFSDYLYMNPDNRSDLKVISNLIFAVYNEKAYEELGLELFWNKISTGGSRNWLVSNKDRQRVFLSQNNVDESQTDYRSRYMIFYANEEHPLSGKWYLSENTDIRDANAAIIPIIRSSELQYILAECYARQGNFGEAAKILMEVRSNRGCVDNLSITDWKSFEEELIREARREWMSEGQLFYLFKRLDADIEFYGTEQKNRPLVRNEYLVPIPSNQSL